MLYFAVKMLEDNKYLSKRIENLALPETKFLEIKTPQGHSKSILAIFIFG